MPRHRTAHTSEPPEDDLVKVLPRTSYPTLPTWIDNFVTKIDHLVQLLTNADDLPRSAHGWVFLRALRRYDGPAVPGNQDLQTNQIVHSHSFFLTSRNSAIDFTEKVLLERSRKGQRQRQRKRKELQITLARYTFLPTALASHHYAWQRLRHIGAPACSRYTDTFQPTYYTLATGQLHHLSAPAWLSFHNSWIRHSGNTSNGFTIYSRCTCQPFFI